MKEVSFEKKSELMARARRLKYDELIPIYMTAAIIAEADASPAEVVSYMEEHFMEA